MYIRRTSSQIVVHAPAKVNLFLEVIAKRPDGFHEIETLMVGITWFDTLHFTASSGGAIELSCAWAGGLSARSLHTQSAMGSPLGDLPEGPQNIVYRALELLRVRAGVSAGARVRLVKRIPAAAGLGGASSDAAAALLAASEAWGLGWSRGQLSELAGELGSDIPFFLGRGGAVCRGRGEQIEAVTATRMHLVVAKPPVGLSTPRVYSICRPASKAVPVAPLQDALARGDLARAGKQLHNRLEEAAEQLTPWIGKLREAFNRFDVAGHQMSGSGSSYFGICRSARHARRTAARLRSMRLGTVQQAVTLT